MGEARSKNIVILGGSIGGLGTAHYLLRHVLKQLPDHQVVIVCPNTQFLWRPACPRALVSEEFAKDSRILVQLSEILKQYPEDQFRLVQGTATNVDGKERFVEVQLADGQKETLNFDALVVATGASTKSPLLGLTEGDSLLQESWKKFQQAVKYAAPKRIVIAGGGPAGIETAGELAEHFNGSRPKWARNVTIIVVTGAQQILPHLRPSIAATAERYLTDLGVKIIKNTKVLSVSPEDAGTVSNLVTQTSLKLDNRETLEADLYIPAMGTKPNTSFMDASLLAPDQRIKVDSSTLRIEGNVSRMYAVGDASTYARPTIHGMFGAIPVLCTNMKRDLLPKEAPREDRLFVEDKRETQFVPIGSRRGVGAAMGWKLPSRLVAMAKGKNYLLWTSGGITSGKQWAKE